MTVGEPTNEQERALEVHERSKVLLPHVHLERELTPTAIDYIRPAEDLPDRQVDIPKLRAGGVNIVWLSDGVAGEFKVGPEAHFRSTTEPNHRPAMRTVFRGSSEVHRMVRRFDAVRRLCADHADQLGLANSVREATAIVPRATRPHDGARSAR